jgi:hypothetical protein
MKSNVWIAHACVKTEQGNLIHGKTHADCFHYARSINVKMSSKAIHQGFVTNEGKYVDRTEAYLIAQKAGQIKYDCDQNVAKILFSEDLYHEKHNGLCDYINGTGYVLKRSTTLDL